MRIVICAVACIAMAAAAATVDGRDAAQSPQRVVIPEFGTGTAAISGVVMDLLDDRPIPGAAVSIVIQSGNIVGPSLRQTTDELGRFAFADLPASDGYILGARKVGFEAGTVFGTANGQRNLRTLALTEGEWNRTSRCVSCATRRSAGR